MFTATYWYADGFREVATFRADSLESAHRDAHLSYFANEATIIVVERDSGHSVY